MLDAILPRAICIMRKQLCLCRVRKCGKFKETVVDTSGLIFSPADFESTRLVDPFSSGLPVRMDELSDEISFYDPLNLIRPSRRWIE